MPRKDAGNQEHSSELCCVPVSYFMIVHCSCFMIVHSSSCTSLSRGKGSHPILICPCLHAGICVI